MTSYPLWLWIAFNGFVLLMLFLDLAVFQRKSHELKFKEAILWSAFWMALAVIFNIGVYIFLGSDLALKFLTGYIIEQSLSVDNLFVFLLIFASFRVPAQYQHKILFWGILGVIVMRGIFIFTGVALIQKFHWIIYLMGGILVVSGFKLFFEQEKKIDPEKNVVIKFFRRIMPVTTAYENGAFFVRRNNVLTATPMFVTLLMIETTDVIFAVDSVPAVLAITTDPFIVYSSNIFAIMGLRALYFVLAGMMRVFHYLHYGLAAILIFVGIKMTASHFVHIPILAALFTVAGILSASILASLILPKKTESACKA